MGGGLLIANYGFRDFRVSSVSKVTDGDWLRERNPKAFQLDKTNNTVGSAWKTGSVGDVFKDETYYVFQDWGWMNGVKIGGATGKEFSGGENLKNYIDGIGFKVVSVSGDDKWTNNEWERNRTIKLKRILMSNYEGYRFGGGYKYYEKTSCLLRTSDKSASSGPQIYLLIGWASGGTLKDIAERSKNFKLSDGHGSFCDWYEAGNYREKEKNEISVSFELKDGKTITGKEFPVIAHSKSFTPFLFKNKQGQFIHPIILGVAIKGQIKDANGERTGKRLTKEGATQAIRKKINNEIVGIYSNNGKMIGLKIKEGNGGNKLVGAITEDDWRASATFKYQYN